MTVCCPTCGRSMIAGRAPIEALSGAPLSMQERKIVEALARAYPRLLTKQFIYEVIYGDAADGGPLDMDGTLKVLMWRLRKKLPAYGWTIPKHRGGSGNYGTYRLEALP